MCRAHRAGHAAAVTESELIQALRALMRRGGKPDDFVVDRDGCAIRVQYFPGSSSHMVLTAPYVGRALGAGEGYRERAVLEAPRPMRIALRREEGADVRAKHSGVAVEAQTGDAAFDEAVYVDSPSSHATIQQVLGSQALRDAARELLALGVGPIVIDDLMGNVEVRVSAFSGIRRPTRLVDAFAAVVSHVPEVRANGQRLDADRWKGAQILMGAAVFVGLIPASLSIFVLLPARCYESDDEGTSLVCTEEPACCTPALGGLAGGALVGALLGVTLFSRIRGASNSHTVRWWVALFALLLGIEAGVTLAHVVGGVLLRVS